jgi:septal ring-binding cell division protein DamX
VTPLQNNHSRPGKPRVIPIAAALLLAAALAGCGPANTGLQQGAARQLQERVLGVSQAAAGSDHAAALKGLESLEADLGAAATNGQVSEDRRRSILAAVAAVRADLEAAAATAEAAKAAEEAAAAEKAKADAAAQAAQQETAAPAPAPAETPRGSAGKGKGKGE